MDLPGIVYGRQVQTLGRHSAASEASAGMAWGRAANRWAAVLGDAADAAAASEAHAAYQQGVAESQEIERTLKHTQVWDTNQMGDVPEGVNVRRTETAPDGSVVQRQIIPIHEVGTQIYDSGSRDIASRRSANLTGMSRKMFDAKFGDYLNSRRALVIEDQVGKAKDFGAARMLEAMESTVVSSTWDKRAASMDSVESMVYLGVKNGYWNHVEGTAKIKKARKNIAYSAGLRLFNDATSELELEQLQSMVINDRLMDPDDARKLVNHAESKLGRINAERAKAEKDYRERNDVELMQVFQTGSVPQQDVIALSRQKGTSRGTRELQGMFYRSGLEGPGISDPEFLQGLNSMITMAKFSGGARETAQELSTLIYEDALTEDPMLNRSDANKLLEAAQSMVAEPYQTEAYRSARARVAREITGYELDPMTGAFSEAFDRPQDVANQRRFADAEFALRQYAESAGPLADPVAWWEETGKDGYTVEAWETLELHKVRLDPASMTVTDGRYDADGSKAAWEAAAAAGTMTVEKKNTLLRKLLKWSRETR